MLKIKVEKPSDDKKRQLQIPNKCEGTPEWSVWECEPSSFDWHYDSTEIAYVYEGKVKVTSENGDVQINKGDLVTFPAGLSCKWQIFEKVRKVYQFK